jgi:hypothetical protein
MSTTEVQPSAPVEPVTPEPSEPKSKASAPKRTPAKGSAKPKAKPAKTSKAAKAKPVGAKAKRNEQHPWLVPAVAAARKLSGAKPGSGGEKTVAYSGPKEHLMVRERVTAMVDGPVTPEKILALTGLKSFKIMKEIAEWKADKSELVPLRKLSAEFQGNGWAQGRYLCAILCAWCDELRRAKKS